MNGRPQYCKYPHPGGYPHAWTLLALLLLITLSGCNSFGSGKLVQQLQNENERLLTEFRAEKKRREEFEKQNRTLEARLSESEKLLARQSQGASSRLSSLPSSVGLPPLQGEGASTTATPSLNPSLHPADTAGSVGDTFRWQRRVN